MGSVPDRGAEPVQHAPAAIPLAWHLAAVAWVGGMLLFARFAPVRYEAALQEDHFVEWWTAALFAAAAGYRLRSALRRRAAFDLLVALFCVFVAGEEFSWGQRLLGFTPPDVFLQHNYQQEFNVHNFAGVFGRPKGVLSLALAGYALLAPLGRLRLLGPLFRRLGVTPPGLDAAAWFALAAALLAWYPADYTGEWVEALAGATFLVAALPQRRRLLLASGATALLALALAAWSGHGGRTDAMRSGCARAEVQALVQDLEGAAALPDLVLARGVHVRLYTALLDGYVDHTRLEQFHQAACGENSGRRRLHAIDPWGNAYWIATTRADDGALALTVYSMGPNRRRDERAGRPAGDDVAAFGLLRP